MTAPGIVAVLLRGLCLLWLVAGLAACAPSRIRTPAGMAPATAMPPRPGPVPAATFRPYAVNGKTYYPLPSSEGFEETGIASWYGPNFHGRKTANGETYDMHAKTAAHKTLPMNSMVLVSNLDNNRETVARINDRGPFVSGRIIDLSRAGAEEIGMLGSGVARVRLSALGETVATAPGTFVRHYDLTHGDFVVQVAAFRLPENAGRLQSRLQGSGWKAETVRMLENGVPIYRVRVAAGNELNNARRVENRLREAGYADAFLLAR